jgi:hypothetical protein
MPAANEKAAAMGISEYVTPCLCDSAVWMCQKGGLHDLEKGDS